jgi:hypothetical protein
MKQDATMKQTEVRAAAVPPLHMPDTASAIEGALAGALEFCAQKLRLSTSEAALERVFEGDPTAMSYTHYHLAVKVGEALGSLDQSVLAVYLYSYDATAEDMELGGESQRLPIHLIALTERKTSALSALVAALDRALTGDYAELVGPSDLSGALDIQIIDRSDVAKRIGAAALLTSIHNPAIQIWAR